MCIYSGNIIQTNEVDLVQREHSVIPGAIPVNIRTKILICTVTVNFKVNSKVLWKIKMCFILYVLNSTLTCV